MATADADNRAVDDNPDGGKNRLNGGHVRTTFSSTQENPLVVNHDQGTAVEQEKLNAKTAATFGSMMEQSTLVVEGPKQPLEQIQVESVERVTPEHSGRSSEPKREDMNIVSSSDKEGNEESPVPPSFAEPVAANETTCAESDAGSSNDTAMDHSPTVLPRFKDPNTCMWTASHAANAPSEDRSASLVNVLLRPLNEQHSLVRMSCWTVIDGHGGGCVATYASEVLLPHIVASVSRSLECDVVHRGECRVNGELRDAGAIDFDGLIRSSHESHSNPNSIHYKTPNEDSDDDDIDSYYTPQPFMDTTADTSVPMEQDCDPSDESGLSLASSLVPKEDMSHSLESSAKTSVKTASPVKQTGPIGTHSTDEVARVTRAITESFCAVDEGWINSIDVTTTRQTSCQNNGSWNAGACALVVFTVQRLEWTDGRGEDASHGRDATTVCFGGKGKCATSSLSTISSTSSLSTTTELMNKQSVGNEMPETEPEDTGGHDPPSSGKESASREKARIYTPGGCGCHFFLGHDAMLYTAHVGDCRAVLLGNAPPTTIEVPPSGNAPVDSVDEYQNNVEESQSEDEQDGFSSDEEDFLYHETSVLAKTPPHMRYMNRPSRRMRITGTRKLDRHHRPFLALPPLDNKKEMSSSSDESSDDGKPARKVPRNDQGYTAPCYEDSAPDAHTATLQLSPHVRPIDLTTDHSAYNSAECAAVLRRCNNDPKAISTSINGGIRRVAGSLAVTRALGDAYLKTPLLSFFPYKRHAPYITARPEVNCRLVAQGGDSNKNSNVLVLASDGVWENSKGADVLRWIRNHESAPSENDAGPKKRKHRQTRTVSGKTGSSTKPTAAEIVVRRVLNKVSRSKNTSVQDLLALPKGRARRSKHDDITTTVVDLSAFVV